MLLDWADFLVGQLLSQWNRWELLHYTSVTWMCLTKNLRRAGAVQGVACQECHAILRCGDADCIAGCTESDATHVFLSFCTHLVSWNFEWEFWVHIKQLNRQKTGHISNCVHHSCCVLCLARVWGLPCVGKVYQSWKNNEWLRGLNGQCHKVDICDVIDEFIVSTCRKCCRFLTLVCTFLRPLGWSPLAKLSVIEVCKEHLTSSQKNTQRKVARLCQ